MSSTRQHTSAIRRNIFRGLKIGLILYGIIGIALYYLQDKFLFHPKRIEANTTYSFTQPHREITIPIDGKTSYTVVVFPAQTSMVKGVILYFHGNKDNVEHYAAYAENFINNGWQVLMVDYPGFGKSTGALTEQALYDQALQVYKLARSMKGADSIIIYGRSLGTGIATQLASIRDCKALILETPYYSLHSLASNYLWMYPVDQMIKYTIPTYTFIQKVTAPITIFHGDDDELIPLRNALKLKPFLKQNDKFIIIKEGHHNTLNNFPAFHSTLDSVLMR